MKTYVATKNLGKLEEMKSVFAGTELELDTFPLYSEAPEDADNYAGNAESKARMLHQQLREAGVHGAVLSDDSGLEVAALGGRPGVLSARYAGKEASWQTRREKLLEELAHVPAEQRGARFCCAMMLILETGEDFTGYGEVDGVITAQEHGRFGFGYDPVFFYPPADMTFAQMRETEKDRVSHRRRAGEALLASYREWLRKR
ncbi:MAG TPA: non-canonical purine NTP pyrophosphatase [Candidatus Baltobacteraceae bacterium]|nr:non-canonical purine NTP pyrophosphatase [Candidatus Baltobacteraceae bacterium]